MFWESCERIMLKFYKYCGAGNDFVLLDNRNGAVTDPAALAKRLCDRHFGVGADGMMLVERPEQGGDCKMRFYNNDGSTAEMCGNGARCICRFCHDHGISGDIQRIETPAGLVTGRRVAENQYRIRLNSPTVLHLQTLAAGVGDLKKVLSNVKTRGILGEIQLGAILQELLTPDQYAENIATRPGSTQRVEFALKLPGDGEQPVWMPIDAKYPADAYEALLDAYDTADPAQVDAAVKELDRRVRSFAKDIHDKYIEPPATTDFGVMFLPVEGLYAEVVRRGTAQRIQQDYKVVVAGPTTMSALLNSLQMGFRTLAIQKRSGEVWGVLGRVRTEFDTFAKALSQTQNRLNQASNELENLVGVRTRQIQRRLDEVSRLSPDDGGPAQLTGLK